MKTFRCGGVGFERDHVIQAQANEEVLQAAPQHALNIPQVKVTPKQPVLIAGLLREEASPT